MIKKVGIPRSLFYYKYFPLWKTFFEELGAELVVSDRTSKRILDEGVMSCVDEACLPVKLYHGHVLNLKDRVDYLFIPRFTSISRHEYICPKFGGLPDMIRHTLKDLPTIIDAEVNLRKSKRNSLKAAFEIGSYFSKNHIAVKQAYKKALVEYRAYRERVKNGSLPCDELNCSGALKAASDNDKNEYERKLNIAVIGHVYNLYDGYMNMNMLKKLTNNNVNVITADMVDEDIINKKTSSLNKRMFWNFGRKAVGSALHVLDRDDIDGIIYVMSFGCGVDSFVCDFIERRVRRSSSIPFIVLTIDEHSGEAGMDTRLEAFIDMIRWRRTNETHVPAYG